VTVAEILGHSIETAQRYSLPPDADADNQVAIERLAVDQWAQTWSRRPADHPAVARQPDPR
jgi:hypothetical protein